MANYKVRAYFGTGFNTLNIPDRPALVEESATHTLDLDALEILQDMDLQEIRVKARWETMQDVDYVKLYTDVTAVYYFVDGVTMLSTDTCSLSVTQDFLTTSGGIDNLIILDGITSRVHVSDDSIFYTEDDPMTAPAERMTLDVEWYNPLGTETTVYVESTIDLARQASQTNSRVYYDGTDALGEYTNAVVVPQVAPVATSTYQTNFGYNPTYGTRGTTTAKTRVYSMNNDTVIVDGFSASETTGKGIAACRALGVENSIINQVEIPNNAIEVESECFGMSTTLGHFTDEVISKIVGKGTEHVTSISSMYASVKNKRCLYGSYTPVGIITLTGDKMETNIENTIQQLGEAPEVVTIVDPHLDGKPYFYLKKNIFKQGSEVMSPWNFSEAISGLQWKQVPLVFTEASGNALTAMNFGATRHTAATAQGNTLQSQKLSEINSNLNQDLSLANSIMGLSGIGDSVSGLSDSIGGNLAQAALGVGVNALTSILGVAYQAYTSNIVKENNSTNRQLSQYWTKRSYGTQRMNDLMQYQIDTRVSQPDVRFPYQSEPARELYGNGVLVYRYNYTQHDIARIDKLLTMYGYKYTKTLEDADFTSRERFNYVECSNVTVKFKTVLPRRYRDGVAMMLRMGVRVWHEKPNVEAYLDNDIKGA